MVLAIAIGLATSAVFALLAVFGVIYYYAAAWISVVTLSVSLGVALWEWLKKNGFRKKVRLPYSIGLALGILLLGWGLIAWVPLTPIKDPIAVSPPEVKLTDLFDSHNHFRGYSDLLVYNRGDDPYYQIWVKILIESEFLSADTIDLDFPTLEGRIKDGDEPNSVMMSATCMGGQDKNSTKAFLCFIDSLAPKKSFHIKMTSNYNTAHMSDKDIGKARIVVSKFENYPAKTSDNVPGDEKAAAFTAHFPNTEGGFTSSRYVWLCAGIRQHWSFDQRSKICTPNSRN